LILKENFFVIASGLRNDFVSRKGAKERKEAINFAPYVFDLSVLA